MKFFSKTHIFLDNHAYLFILLTVTYVKLQGEFLEPSHKKLSPNAMIVALVYNLKAEALSHLAPLEDETEFLPQNLPADSLELRKRHKQKDMFAEWDTEETVHALRDAIAERYNVVMIEANEQAYNKLLTIRPDFVFNIAEGLHGASREAQIPAILEMLQIPYLGSDPLTLGICLDKARAKEILAYHKIPTAGFTVIRSMSDFDDVRLKFPAMVKPLHEGSSKGIYNSCVVRNPDELANEVKIVLDTYNQPALVEDFLSGREFTVAILGNGDDVQVLPIVEIKFDALPAGVNPIYSYEAKWIWDQRDNPLDAYECPAKLTEPLKAEIESVCRDAYRVLNCRDWSRIDVRLDAHGTPNVLEINPLPGILPKPEDNSSFPKAARAAGVSYNQLINAVLDIAMQRNGIAPITKAVNEPATGGEVAAAVQ
jgi:D-alanine-D-alanine ligase